MKTQPITRSEVRFFIYLAGILMVLVLWGSRLEARVEAVDKSNENYNNETHEKGDKMVQSVNEIREELRIIRKSQLKIQFVLGIE